MYTRLVIIRYGCGWCGYGDIYLSCFMGVSIGISPRTNRELWARELRHRLPCNFYNRIYAHWFSYVIIYIYPRVFLKTHICRVIFIFLYIRIYKYILSAIFFLFIYISVDKKDWVYALLPNNGALPIGCLARNW